MRREFVACLLVLCGVFCPITAFAKLLPEITFGVYYVTPRFRSQSSLKAKKLLKDTSRALTSDVFAGKSSPRFKIIFEKNLPTDSLPFFSAKGGVCVLNEDPQYFIGIAADYVWPTLCALSHPQDADIYLFLFDQEIVRQRNDRTCDVLNGGAAGSRNNHILIGGFARLPLPRRTLMHELGHWLGLGHTESKLCGGWTFLMCPEVPPMEIFYLTERVYQDAWRARFSEMKRKYKRY